jgi:NADH dehydrogenase
MAVERICVTGANGFVGDAVVEELLNRGYAVNALVRGKFHRPEHRNLRAVHGDLFDKHSLDNAVRNCTAVIHLVGIIMEKPAKGITFERIHVRGTEEVLAAALRGNIPRFVQMSALGTRPGAESEYHRTKFAAETLVRSSGLEWTIIRPSLIHGPAGEFMKNEARWARGRAPAPLFFMPVMPYFGAGLLGRGGAGMLQPVFVGDVARAFVDALEKPQTIGQVYPLGGGETLTWPMLHHRVAELVVDHRRPVVPIPVWAGKFYAAIGIAGLLGFNRDQVIMSQEDNTCDLGKFVQDFGWMPQAFSTTFPSYADQL